MLTIQEYRNILDDQESSDEEIKRRYDAAYQIADAIFDQWLSKRNKDNETHPKNVDIPHKLPVT
jgi:exonuclease V gamma subunit